MDMCSASDATDSKKRCGEWVVVSRGQTTFFLCVWVGKKGSGKPSIEILCDRIARNWRVNEALTSWIELKRLVNKLVDNLRMTPQNGQLLTCQVIKLVGTCA